MRGRGAGSGLAVLAAIAAFATQAAAAHAATTIGQSPPTAGSATHCALGSNFVDLFQDSNAFGTSYLIPEPGGVLTGWTSTTTGAASRQAKLRVFTYESPTSVTPMGESTVETVTSAPATFKTRIPVEGGEALGFAANGNVGGCAWETTASFDRIGLSGGASGSLGKPESVSHLPGRLLNVSAVLEPDENGDGFGDETQTPPKCGGERATITSSREDEKVRGTPKDDVIVALGGDDVVQGLGGDDLLCGRKGSDVLLGHGGSDVLIGEGGRDRLAGGGGTDVCRGGGARDRTGGCEKGTDR